MNRRGELGAVPIRTERVFAVHSAWYFDTREGPAIGPYISKSEAKQGLSDFIEYLMLSSAKILQIGD
jgi:hypothetical protein